MFKKGCALQLQAFLVHFSLKLLILLVFGNFFFPLMFKEPFCSMLLEFIFCFISKKLITSWPLVYLQLHFDLDPDSLPPHSNVINRIVIRLFGKPWQSSTVDLSGLNFAFYVTWNTEMRKCK